MDVHLTTNQQALMCQAIESGRVRDANAAVQEALALWEDRELTRADLIASIDAVEASIERGEGIDITEESMRLLAEDVKQRAHARLAAGQADVR